MCVLCSGRFKQVSFLFFRAREALWADFQASVSAFSSNSPARVAVKEKLVQVEKRYLFAGKEVMYVRFSLTVFCHLLNWRYIANLLKSPKLRQTQRNGLYGKVLQRLQNVQKRLMFYIQSLQSRQQIRPQLKYQMLTERAPNLPFQQHLRTPISCRRLLINL